MFKQKILLLLILSYFLGASPVFALAQEPEASFERAYVQNVIEINNNEDKYPTQKAEVRLITGPNAKSIISIEHELVAEREDLRISSGQTIVVQSIKRLDGTQMYYFQEVYRLNSLLIIFLFFLILTAYIGKKKGLMAIAGLAISLGIIIFGMFPLFIRGWNVFGVSILGTFLIACSTIFVAHGFSRRTTVALVATCSTLLFAILLAAISVKITSLFGLGSEESVFLWMDPSMQIDPKGLLLAGIIIGALGVLDDITTTQVAAIDEVQKANPSYGFKKLYSAGFSVGHEHIASMINTLALAYIGASLPMFLLLFLDTGVPLWVTINSAFIVEEIIRTLVGSAALLLAVPFSTSFAAYV
ncbi:MAG: YibE/F family protein, partial [Candidatus Peribacteraceae bacterium]|nr:YibE/F family protein [Candidatus Peribacteraceae bacterium]